ncbi:uncharacterized protein LOC124365016 [Homalodisca vitripennis]|uniref:uncharacterized protein LOC124365016 n=1 Tax=Homalodisca vitripennis TaxID=197043 RepID=UPI001EEBE40B|nr:uncharacterized protein LOC124365016 [Homalodisca vitripennis]
MTAKLNSSIFYRTMALHRMLKTNCVVHLKCCNNSSANSNSEKAQKMILFWENEMVHKTNLQYDVLSEEEKIIHNMHDEAVRKGHFTYNDPITNERILTRLRHYLRGKCCGNACRHCVYDHENVIDEYKLRVRTFNTSFWTYPPVEKDVEFDDSCYFDGTNLKVQTNRRSASTTFEFSAR